MITKKFKRHLSLQNLDLKANQLLWDIGAGSGSCGIEAYKRYKVKTILFENQELRCEYIEQNLTKHHVLDTLLLKGDAQELFKTLETNPNKIFVGGGGEKVIKELPYLYERLQSNGIMLINAITLKHLSLMINTLNEAEIEFETHSISLTTYKGQLDLVEPERQLFQIKVFKK
jgi:precorrin-6Y C5,15-methyltransferase (decarboxylating)